MNRLNTTQHECSDFTITKKLKIEINENVVRILFYSTSMNAIKIKKSSFYYTYLIMIFFSQNRSVGPFDKIIE